MDNILWFALVAGMTWIKLDDKAPRHPKIAGLSDRAFRWWIQSLCYASEFLTDGLLPKAFYVNVPKQVRAELTQAGLWEFTDPNLSIHDYLGHQSSRDFVDTKRAQSADRVRKFRELKRNGNAVTPSVGNAVSNAPVTLPEYREQRTDTENREQTTKGGGLIVGGAEYFRLQQTHAFVGSVLRIPNKLHSELLGKSGGAHRDPELQAWYGTLDEALEKSGAGTGDVFVWIRPRHQAFAIERGWIEAAPKVNGAKRDTGASIEHLEAIARGERKY